MVRAREFPSQALLLGALGGERLQPVASFGGTLCMSRRRICLFRVIGVAPSYGVLGCAAFTDHPCPFDGCRGKDLSRTDPTLCDWLPPCSSAMGGSSAKGLCNQKTGNSEHLSALFPSHVIGINKIFLQVQLLQPTFNCGRDKNPVAHRSSARLA